MQKFTGKSFDPYGRYAARGNVEMNLLETFLADRNFRREPPKSFDVLDFKGDSAITQKKFCEGFQS